MIRELGDGLVLRRGRMADADQLADFNARVHGEEDSPDPAIAAWTRDLLAGTHPTFPAEDFLIIEEAATGRIISSLCLISQTWSYGGVPFGVGRPELVGTAPDYRRKGLVRIQFEEIHRWSAARGELVQGITGIPWYYRQFGYEYALGLDGGMGTLRALLPPPEPAPDQRFHLRPATVADIPFLMRVERCAAERALVAAERDAALWRYELHGRNVAVGVRRCFVLERADGERAGYLSLVHQHEPAMVAVVRFELAPGTAWPLVVDPVLRFLHGQGITAEQHGNSRFERLDFRLEREHPWYQAARQVLVRTIPSYAWYIRVPDLSAFLTRITPALEARLAASDLAGHSGTLLLDFFRMAVRLVFAEGRLTVMPMPKGSDSDDDDDVPRARFPDLTFLQLLFGLRSLDELSAWYPDCSLSSPDPVVRALLLTLFPKRPSHVWPID